MLDTHAVAQSLTDAELTPAQADAITNAVRLAAEQGDPVTSDQFKAGQAEVKAEIAEVRTEIATLDTRLSTEIAEVRTEIAGVRTEIGNLEAPTHQVDCRNRAHDGCRDGRHRRRGRWRSAAPRRVSARHPAVQRGLGVPYVILVGGGPVDRLSPPRDLGDLARPPDPPRARSPIGIFGRDRAARIATWSVASNMLRT